MSSYQQRWLTRNYVAEHLSYQIVAAVEELMSRLRYHLQSLHCSPVELVVVAVAFLSLVGQETRTCCAGGGKAFFLNHTEEDLTKRNRDLKPYRNLKKKKKNSLFSFTRYKRTNILNNKNNCVFTHLFLFNDLKKIFSIIFTIS